MSIENNTNISEIPKEFEIRGGVLIKYRGKSGTVAVPDSITQIADDAFDGCETVILPPHLAEMKERLIGCECVAVRGEGPDRTRFNFGKKPAIDKFCDNFCRANEIFITRVFIEEDMPGEIEFFTADGSYHLSAVPCPDDFQDAYGYRRYQKAKVLLSVTEGFYDTQLELIENAPDRLTDTDGKYIGGIAVLIGVTEICNNVNSIFYSDYDIEYYTYAYCDGILLRIKVPEDLAEDEKFIRSLRFGKTVSFKGQLALEPYK